MFTPAGAKLSRAIKPGDVEGGWRYFTGQTSLKTAEFRAIRVIRLDNVGRFGGGTLGPNLDRCEHQIPRSGT